MQPTILNKVVSLFLIGGLVLSIGALLLWCHFPPTPVPQPLQDLLSTGGEALFAVVGGLAILPLAALAGAISEAVTDLTTRRFIKATSNWRILAFLLGQPRAFKFHSFWKAEFLKAVKDYRFLQGTEIKENDRGFAVGVLYGSGQNESIAWGESHYSTFIFFSNLATLAALGEIYVLIGGQKGWFTSDTTYWTISFIFLFYAFSSLSLHRYLYSYQVAFRQAAIAIRTGQTKGKPDAHNPVAAQDG